MADETRKIRRALISVYDKTGIVEFARALVDEFGIEIISTGGTANLLTENNIPVTLVEDVTGFPEMLDGRVKTLHPKIHAGILADRDNPEHMRQLAEAGIEPIDMIVVNLYPFAEVISRPDSKQADRIEMIDIGGPCLMRAAAKNYAHVYLVGDPIYYATTLEDIRTNNGGSAFSDRMANAIGAFQHTCKYDLTLYRYWSTFFAWMMARMVEESGDEPSSVLVPANAILELAQIDQLRYGENPEQEASWWGVVDECGISHRGNTTDNGDSYSLQIAGDELSYNNLADAAAAVQACGEISRELREVMKPRVNPKVCCFIKHTNACGAGLSDNAIEALRRAYLGDPNAAMGGVLAVDFNVDVAFATAALEAYQRWGKPLRESGASNAPGAFFLEVWIAPSFDEEAVQVITGAAINGPKKQWGKRVRLLEVGGIDGLPRPESWEYRSVGRSLLVQSRDIIGLNENQWKVVTKRTPTDKEMDDLRLAWLICKHTKSNAITICRGAMLIGNGAGQMSRVMSCRVATWLAQENGHLNVGNREPGTGNSTATPVASSDAFFPFRDGVDVLIDAGVTAVIQPGGSKRDDEVIAACDERGVAMIFTGTRHFKH